MINNLEYNQFHKVDLELNESSARMQVQLLNMVHLQIYLPPIISTNRQDVFNSCLIKYQVSRSNYRKNEQSPWLHCSIKRIVSEIQKIVRIQKLLFEQIKQIEQELANSETHSNIIDIPRFRINLTIIHRNTKILKSEYQNLDVRMTSEQFCTNCKMLLNVQFILIQYYVKQLNQLISKPPNCPSIRITTKYVQRSMFLSYSLESCVCKILSDPTTDYLNIYTAKILVPPDIAKIVKILPNIFTFYLLSLTCCSFPYGNGKLTQFRLFSQHKLCKSRKDQKTGYCKYIQEEVASSVNVVASPTLNASTPYIYKQYQSIIQPMGKKTTHLNPQNNNDAQLQKHRQLMARFDTLQVALAEAITQNQALRERVVELQALLVAVQMKEQARQLKDKQQSEEGAKKDKRRKKMQKNRNYK